MVLRCRDGVYEIRVNGWELMSNRAHRSEEAMAELACAGRGDGSHILIGGLGMVIRCARHWTICPAVPA
ncbi:MAG: hypothetical protein WDN69_33225 [Aliidongia sp.]